MKSNEEFIAGIYEKAAAYTEEKETNSIRTVWVAKATRIAATIAVCLGLTGIGSMMLGNKDAVPGRDPQPAKEEYGIALSSELADDMDGASMLRVGPVAETVTFTGVVTSVNAEENRIWLTLVFDVTAPDTVVGSVVCIRWDMLTPISEDITEGTTLTATGVPAEYNGCTELILTDMANLEIK